jgi:hypothetical protein
MEEPVWWPSGIAQQSMAEANEAGELRTSSGRIQLWDTSEVSTAAWWNSPPGNGVKWGQWPHEVTTVTLVSEDSHGFIVRLDDAWLARVCPFLVGEDVSRMARYEPWHASLDGLPVVLPVGGWSASSHDRVLIYAHYESASIPRDASNIIALATSMGAIHASLAAFETPNTERLWNDRLKAMEDELKPHTMWRAPHTSATVGLPPLHFNLNHLATIDQGLAWIAMPRTVADALVCQPERLPSIASLMRLERQWSQHTDLDATHRQSLLTAWGAAAPRAWSKGKALSTALGGAWVWRYNAVLEQLFHARTYGDTALEQTSLDWLGEVSRLQARLGTLRMWKSGFWVALTGVIVAYVGNDWGTFSSMQSLMIAAGSAAFWAFTNRMYWAKDPLPY